PIPAPARRAPANRDRPIRRRRSAAKSRTARTMPSAARRQSCRAEQPARRSPAAALLPLLLDAALLQVAGARLVLVVLGEHLAGVRLAAECGERDAELQEIVGALGAGLVDLVSFGEGRHGVLVVAPRIVGLAQPILRVAGQHMAGVTLQEGLEAALGARIVA